MELLTTITTYLAQAGIELLEIAVRHKPHVTLSLTRFMNIALIVMLCAEIIRLVLVRTPLELAIVAGMVALHGAISFLISWEVNREQSHDRNRGTMDESDQDVLL